MKKRIFLSLLCILTAALLLCAFAACNETKEGEEEETTYTVVFKADGDTVDTVSGASKKDIKAPKVPDKAGYSGAWEKYTLGDETEITVDAVYTLINYKVTFVADGEKVGECTFNVENKSITVPEVPDKQCYTKAWADYELGTESVTVEAVYTLSHADLKEVKASEPKCNEMGNAKHYYCSGCKKCFSDEKGETEVAESSVKSNKVSCEYQNSDACKWCGGHKALKYELNGNGSFYTVTGIGSFGGGALTVPSEHNGKPVRVISDGAFKNCRSLTKITLPNSIIEIGKDAFNGCTGLAEAHINDISKWCDIEFDGTDANPLKYAKKLYLNGEAVTELEIPEGVTKISAYAFCNCTDITLIKLPASLSSISSLAIYGCTALTEISVAEGNAAYKSENGSLYTKDGKTLVKYATGKADTSFTVPENVTFINNYAFYGCVSLESVTVPQSVTRIGNSAFRDCAALNTVALTDGLTGIEAYAFCGCTSLNGISLPNTVTELGNYAFEGCTSLGTVVLSNNLPAIGANTFYNCVALGSITVPSSVTSIGEYAFYNCTNISSIILSDGVTEIDRYAFGNCIKLTSILIPKNVSSITALAFSGCKALTEINVDSGNTTYRSNEGALCAIKDFRLVKYPAGKTDKNITLWNGTKIIGAYAFEGCINLETVTVADGITSIEVSAFRDCTGLVSIVIPNSVKNVGDSAFYGCEKLESVTVGSGVTSIGKMAFCGCKALTEIKIDSGNKVYKSISGNLYSIDGKTLVQYAIGKTDTSFEIPESVTGISEYAFAGCKNLTSITVGKNVTSIGDYAFADCTSLTEIKFNAEGCADLTENSNVFYNAGKDGTGITVTFGDGAKRIPAYLFYVSDEASRPNIKSVTVGKGVTGIGDYAFYGTGITALNIPDNVTGIGAYAFSGCKKLTDVVMGNGVKSIGAYAFCDCEALKSVTVGKNVKSIGDYAFAGNKKLKVINFYASECADFTENSNVFHNAGADESLGITVTFGDGVKRIPAYLFYVSDEGARPSVTSLKIGNSVTSIGKYAFCGCKGLINVDMPISVTSIEEYAFADCKELSNVLLGDGVISIGDYAFAGCTKIRGIVIPNSVKSIGNSAFRGCEVFGGVKIGDNVTSIGNYAFYGCKELYNVLIPDGVKSIGAYAFGDCCELMSVTVGKNVKSIGENAFKGCYKLVEVINKSSLEITVTSYGLSAMEVHKDVSKIVEESLFIFYTYDGVSYLINYIGNGADITLPESYNGERYVIHKYAFYGNKNITSVTIPDNVTGIGDYAFSGCTELAGVTLGNGVTSIGDAAFDGTAYYSDDTKWDNGVLYIGSCLIKAKGLSGEYTVKDGTLCIADSAFAGCTELTEITVPSSVTNIGDSVFSGWNGTYTYKDEQHVI